MKLQLIGSGNRAKAYAMYMKNEIVYVCDPDIEKAGNLIEEYGLENAQVIADYRNSGEIDGIIIAVPDYRHGEVFEWAISRRVPILLEKPVEVSSEKLRSMYLSGIVYDNSIILGFTLRYTYMYRQILRLLDKGAIGEVVSVEASETLDPLHAAKFFRRWHRFEKYSGGFLNTKCSHDMDMLNMVIPGKPIKVASFGRNSIFSKRKGNEICSKDCDIYDDCRFVDKNTYQFSTADPSLCPYEVDSDIVDHQVVSMEFDSGVTAVFTVSMHSDKGDRHIRIHGTEGSVEASFNNQKVILKLTGKDDIVYIPENTGGSHGGGDKVLCSNFLDCVVKNTIENQLADGITASALALAADESRKSGKVVDMRSFADYMYMEK